MSASDYIRTTIRLPFTTAKAVVHQCEREYLLPRQVIARSLGESPTEPILFTIPNQDRWHLTDYKDFSALQARRLQWRPDGDQKKVYLSVLSQLIKAMPKEFAKNAPFIHGTKRVYFGRSREDVESTGKSNEAAQIPESVWWASVNNAGYKKQKTLAALLNSMGFSADYAELISSAPCYRFPPLVGIYFKAE